MAVLGLQGCLAFSLAAVSVGGPLAAVRRLLIVGASLVVQHELWGAQASGIAGQGLRSYGSWTAEHGLSSCGAGLVCSMTCGIFWTRDQTNISCIGK